MIYICSEQTSDISCKIKQGFKLNSIDRKQIIKKQRQERHLISLGKRKPELKMQLPIDQCFGVSFKQIVI